MDDSSTVSVSKVRYRTRPLSSDEVSVYNRFERLLGTNQAALSKLGVVCIGCGGLGGEMAQGLMRKGVGKLWLYDHDTVELSNLNRQRFFQEDLGKNKAICLAKNLQVEATGKTEIVGYPVAFQVAAVAFLFDKGGSFSSGQSSFPLPDLYQGKL